MLLSQITGDTKKGIRYDKTQDIVLKYECIKHDLIRDLLHDTREMEENKHIFFSYSEKFEMTIWKLKTSLGMAISIFQEENLQLSDEC